MKKTITVLIAMISILVLAACSLTPNANFLNTLSATETPTQIQRITPAPTVVVSGADIAKTDLILTNLYEKVNPGVVTIVTMTSAGEGSGSGFVYDKEGHILTNYHVVEDATSIEVDFPTGLKVDGSVIANDIDSDIAVVKVKVAPEELVPLPLGDSDQLKVGQMVVAIGNPYRLTSTMTLGIVSAKGRVLDSIRTASDNTPYSAGDVIQTDAAINPGNSGGPLLNLNGEVVGINRAIRTSGTTLEGEPVNSGIGFAVSINIVKQVVPYLIRDGKYAYPYLGITSSSRDLTLNDWKALGTSRTTGAYVIEVTPGGPADQAGLKAGTKPTSVQGLYSGGDIIIAVDGIPVNVYGDLISYIFKNKLPGDEITLTVIRESPLRGETQEEVKLILGSR